MKNDALIQLHLQVYTNHLSAQLQQHHHHHQQQQQMKDVVKSSDSPYHQQYTSFACVQEQHARRWEKWTPTNNAPLINFRLSSDAEILLKSTD